MAEEKKVLLQPIQVEEMSVKIVGTSPLLMDRFPDAARQEIIDKQAGVSKGQKKKREIKKEMHDAVHLTPKGKPGFPAQGFKKGMVDATSLASDSVRTFNKKHVVGLQIVNCEGGIVPLKFSKQDILQHTIGCNTKFSPQFHDWSCVLSIRYDSSNISAADIINLLKYAGFHVGVGAWRPKGKDGGSGSFGMYDVAM